MWFFFYLAGDRNLIYNFEYKSEIYTNSHIESNVFEMTVLLTHGTRLTKEVNQAVSARIPL